MAPVRVALLSTADPDRPGSMRAYERLLGRTLQRHPQRVRAEVVRLGSGSMGALDRLSDLVLAPRRRLRRDYDVLHLLDGSQSINLFGLPRGKVVVTVHDMIPHLQAEGAFPVPPPGRRARLLLTASRRALTEVGAICAVSRCSARDFERLTGRAVDRVVPLPPPRVQESASATEGPRKRMVLHIGNNGFYKNRVGAVLCFASMLERAPDIELLLLGPEPDAPVRAAIAALPRPSAVRTLVDPSDEEVQGALAEAGVLLFPSLYEGYGWPPLEAMQAGCPVVSSDRGSLPEVVGNAAVLCDPEDLEGFADSACAILDDAARREAFVARGRALVGALDETTFAEAMIKVYEVVACPQTPGSRTAGRS